MKYLISILLILSGSLAFGQQGMFLRGSAASGETAILDGYTVDAAYCPCWLATTYTGALIRVRRDSDDTEQDINRDGKGIDQASLISFCSGANCFVTTKYDQSGGGNHLTQTTASLQPKIYDSVTGLVLSGSLPSISYSGDFLASITAAFTYPATIFSVFKLENTGIAGTTAYSLSAQSVMFYRYGLFSEFAIFSGSAVLRYAVSSVTDRRLSYALHDTPSNFQLQLNDQTVATASSLGNDALNRIFLGGRDITPQNPWGGTITALVIFDSDQSANKDAIRAALNTYFTIY